MRLRAAAILSVLGLLGSAGPALAYDVSYTPITTPAPLTCPENSTLIATMCYCNVGYNLSGGQCVKTSAPAPAQNEIYEDLLMTITINDTMTCAQLGVVATIDKQMCDQYRATSPDKRDSWKSIPRPSATPTGIATPWAPTSQQIPANPQQGIAPIPATPALSPVATTTEATAPPEPKPEETPPPETTDAEKEKIGKALEQVLDEHANDKAPAKSDVADTPATPPVVTGPSLALIELSKKLAAEEAAAAATPPPPPPAAPESSQTAQAAQAVNDEYKPTVIDKIIGFFRWLF